MATAATAALTVFNSQDRELWAAHWMPSTKQPLPWLDIGFFFVSWLDLSATFVILQLLTCRHHGQQLTFLLVVAFLMRLYSMMPITPEARGVCKIQATTGSGNIHIYLVYLLLDDSLLHLIQTWWISHLIFPFQSPFW